MNITIPRQDLLSLLTRTIGSTDPKNAMPILGSLHLAADAGRLTVSGTNLYLSSTCSAPAEVEKPGTIAIPAKDLLDRVKAMPVGPVQLIVSEGAQTTLKAVGSPRRYVMHGMPGEDYPPIDQATEGAHTLPLTVADLATLIEFTHYAISTDETRAHVNSALLKWGNGKVTMAATDGHRLSLREVKTDDTGSGEILIPQRAIGELRRLVSDASGDVTIAVSSTRAHFAFDTVTFACKTVDAAFPPYEQVIPKATTQTISVNRAAFLDAVKAVAIGSDHTDGVRIKPEDGRLVITAQSAEKGSGEDEVAADCLATEESIGVNAEYVLDVLGAIDADEIALGIGGPLDPIKVTVAEDGGCVGVIMPLRL